MDALGILNYLVWLIASVTFILALKFLASPATARRGNLLGAGGMALVVIWTFFTSEGTFGISDNWWIIAVGGAIGAVVGWLGAKRVAMTAMPQMVAIFLALLAVVLGTINVVGGFVVTDRMLEMFKKRPGERP